MVSQRLHHPHGPGHRNHEVRGGSGQFSHQRRFLFPLFRPGHERSYYSRKFGKNFVMYLLDSGHLTPLMGNRPLG